MTTKAENLGAISILCNPQYVILAKDNEDVIRVTFVQDQKNVVLFIDDSSSPICADDKAVNIGDLNAIVSQHEVDSAYSLHIINMNNDNAYEELESIIKYLTK